MTNSKGQEEIIVIINMIHFHNMLAAAVQCRAAVKKGGKEIS